MHNVLDFRDGIMRALKGQSGENKVTGKTSASPSQVTRLDP